MFHLQCKGLPDICLPILKRFSRKTEHQVDADVADADVAEPLYGFTYLSGSMSAVEKTEPIVSKRLRTHADAVDGHSAEGFYIFIRQVVGIAFHRHFKWCQTSATVFYGIKEFLQKGDRQQRWCSATNIHRFNVLQQVFVPRILTCGFQFSTYRFHILLRQMGEGSGVESAVDTTAFAERNVNI